MNRYLIDTHIFIWSIKDPNLLSKSVLKELIDDNNILYISSISLMEIAIKNRDGKLSLGKNVDYPTFVGNIQRFGIFLLNLELRHLEVLNQLSYPKTHRDPFDHLIVSQAISDRICLVSADNKMQYYTKQGLELFEMK